MYILHLFLLLGALLVKGGSSAHAQSNQVYAFAGGNTILPCILIPPASADIPTVEWSKVVEGLKPSIVYLYRHGCETFAMKDPDFEYRTSLILRELQNGNFSLRISNVKLSDSGMYQCMIIQNNGTKEETKVELVVGSSSEPKLSVVSADGDGVTIECEALCWMPAPQMTILDNDGKRLTDEEPKQEQDPRGCYNTRQNVTLQNPVSRVVCKVELQQRNQSKIADILLPDFWKKSYTTLIILSVAVTALVSVASYSLYIWLKKKHSKTGKLTL
ncbi:putative selection and upkeep of intraepithelial T-cells protein 1 homolog isoform X1 [Fundulus heteroclitus]|uniref:putative selection and upkeep of intraepithelial T-cells protein 1 homolog isoform X1 n=1 Tax=Fundulus heteroclitus TaxID=8078 RepID=UPI00165B7593|nr:putative selection and upkeep of intraepithelial T-cells protein 1 homolog isoform X1 [Fundulus heteroclitus]